MALGTTYRDASLNWLTGTAYPPAPASIWVSLHTADPGTTGASEVGSGVGYSRQQLTLDPVADETIGGVLYRMRKKTSALNWGPASGAGFDLVTHFGVWTASTGGTFEEGGDCSDVLVVSGNSARIAAGALKLYRA